jgi:prepilin-type N-terminal cleavage/methylation domain-containing protein
MRTISTTTKGFTLLETLASIAIISFVVIGPLAAIVNSSSYARKTKDTMTATYLAEEAVELLQNQYDSMFVYCRKQPDSPTCFTATGESPSQVAWRLFKERLTATSSQPSCYSVDNPNGCAFDTLNMTGDITAVPTRYDASSPECASIVEVTTPIKVMVPPGGATGNVALVEKVVNRHTYMCQGLVDSNRVPVGASTSTKTFKRTVSVEQLPTPSEIGLPIADQRHDDLRIVTKVDFRTLYGSTGSISITRFMHARQ